MKTLKYGYFGEDNAQQIFLENYLLQLPVYLALIDNVRFVCDEHFKLKGHDRPNVLRIFSEAVQQGLTFHEQDVFFVELEPDDEKMQEHERLHGEMVGKLGGTFIDKTQHMDINRLENRSASFRHFHLQVTDFLRKI